MYGGGGKTRKRPLVILVGALSACKDGVLWRKLLLAVLVESGFSAGGRNGPRRSSAKTSRRSRIGLRRAELPRKVDLAMADAVARGVTRPKPQGEAEAV